MTGSKDTLLGNVVAATATLATLPVAAAKGAYDKMNGGSFEKGFEDVAETVFEKTRDFAEENAPYIKNGIVAVIAGLVLRDLKKPWW